MNQRSVICILRGVVAISLLLWGGAVRAEVALLLPGYLSGVDAWRESGAAAVLAQSGWHDGGHLQWTPNGIMGPQVGSGPKRFLTVGLPATAPLAVQARILHDYVSTVRSAWPDESLWLVGHSAGGVVARWLMVERPDSGIVGLITVASPHGGTEMASYGAMAGDTPLALFAPMMGMEELNHSQGLFRDLMPEGAGRALFWLNRQPHPPARYISVVRGDDGVVPPASQDLNGVVALYGRARTLVAGRGHGLAAGDGAVIARLLAEAQSL